MTMLEKNVVKLYCDYRMRGQVAIRTEEKADEEGNEKKAIS